MVTDTRSTRRTKDEADDSSSKKKVNFREDPSTSSPDVSGARSSREASSSKPTTPSPKSRSSSRQTTPSPQCIRKSKRLEKGLPPLTPPLKRKSERLEKHNTPSPVRRSERGKQNLASNASGSKEPAKELSSESKRRKEKTLVELTLEGKKVEPDLAAVGNKRKMITSRTFRSQFKKQRIREIIPDDDGDLEGRDKLSDVCSGNSKDIDSKPVENDEDISDECNRKVVCRKFQKGIRVKVAIT